MDLTFFMGQHPKTGEPLEMVRVERQGTGKDWHTAPATDEHRREFWSEYARFKASLAQTPEA